jgi:hypothetical protein
MAGEAQDERECKDLNGKCSRAMTYQWTGPGAAPEFEQALADTYVGKYILIGVTYLDHQGQLLEQVQMHGTIELASPDGIVIALGGLRAGESWVMPPVLDSISPAAPGVYNLRSTGERVEDPDLLATWSVTKPCEH